MQKVFEMTLEYAKEREAFGDRWGRFQAIRHKFAEMSVKIEVVTGAHLRLPAQVRRRRGRDSAR